MQTEIAQIEKPRPILKWAGGKRELVPKLRRYYQKLSPKKYIEPFFGGGAVYFDILHSLGMEYAKSAIINDINIDLINLYRHIKSAPDEVLSLCAGLEQEYYQYGYYYVRDRFNGVYNGDSDGKYHSIARSAALIVLNKTCFNGLYRTNRDGMFNVPEGKYNKPQIVNQQNLLLLSKYLPKIENIRNGNFDEIYDIEPGDLVYFDPPYYPLSKSSSFAQYYGNFGANEQMRLRDYFVKLDDMGVMVMLSNSACDFIRELYNGYRIVELECKRNINSNAIGRGKVKEYLILGNRI